MKKVTMITYSGLYEIRYYTIGDVAKNKHRIKITRFNKELTKEVADALGLKLIGGCIDLGRDEDSNLLRVKEYLYNLYKE